MSGKPVRLLALAHTDVEYAIDHYLREAGANVALGFIMPWRRPIAASLPIRRPDLRATGMNSQCRVSAAAD